MTYRVATEADLDRVGQLATLAFNFPFDPKKVTLENIRVLEIDGTISACAKINRFGHYYGGRAIDAGGIGMVAVAAEARGEGRGTQIMHEVLRELRADGVPLSSLYPATLPIYRSCGYGFGAHRVVWTAPLSTLPRTAASRAVPMAADDHADVRAAYERIAAMHGGLVVRPERWWSERVFTDESPHRYLVREDGRVTGWIIYGLGPRAADSWQFPLDVRDLYWETPGAAQALLALAAGHRSTASTLKWVGPLDEPLQSLTPDHGIDLKSYFRSMIRLVDVPAAFEARGYPSSVDASFTFSVDDEVLPDNAGPWHIEVRDGSAKVVAAPGAPPDAHADASTWATLWTGMYTARDVVRLGGLHANAQAIEMLEALFAGPSPWLGDFY